MRSMVGLFGIVVLVACYTPKRIEIPPSDDGLNCMRECMGQLETCKAKQSLIRSCRADYDRCLMICPGAKEDTSPEQQPMDLPGAVR